MLFQDWVPKLKSLEGHVVVRAEPGGGRYRGYVLDHSNERFEVVAVHGPYEAR